MKKSGSKILLILKILLIVISVSAYMVAIFFLSKQVLNYMYNNHVLACYEEGDYSINDNLLLTANYIESYIVHYNNGNINYKNKQYEDAIKCYRKAIKCDDVPSKRKCDIRINIALSIIGTLPDDYEEYDNIDDSIETLLDARDELLTDGCATKDGDGHSEEAEELKEEIEEKIEELKEMKAQMEAEMDSEEKEKREEGKDIQNADEEEREKQEKQQNHVKKDIENSAKEAKKTQQEYMEEYLEKDAEINGELTNKSYNGIW